MIEVELSVNELIEPGVAEAMRALDVEYSAIECAAEYADTRDFCAHYGYSLDESANVLLIASKKGEQKFAACVVLANCRLDGNKVARKKLGAQRVSFANPEQTREITGMELGGVTPFGIPAGVPVWIDAGVMQCERIILGGGNRMSKIIMAPEMLLKISGAEVVENLAYR